MLSTVVCVFRKRIGQAPPLRPLAEWEYAQILRAKRPSRKLVGQRQSGGPQNAAESFAAYTRFAVQRERCLRQRADVGERLFAGVVGKPASEIARKRPGGRVPSHTVCARWAFSNASNAPQIIFLGLMWQ